VQGRPSEMGETSETLGERSCLCRCWPLCDAEGGGWSMWADVMAVTAVTAVTVSREGVKRWRLFGADYYR
jgi:hypothetical protein